MDSIKTGETVVIAPANSLSELTIEIAGRDALQVAASLKLGGLATGHIKKFPKTTRDSAIMERAISKLKR